MSATVIVGTQWGDEGKGKVVDLLAADADVVVRFHGGNNAGHTLVVNGEKTVLNLVPAGVLHPGTVCVMGPGMVIDPAALLGEIDALRARGYLTQDDWLRVSEQAHVIMPYHHAIDRARERLRGAGKIGTTGRGIGPAYEDKIARTGIRVADLLDEESCREALERALHEKNGYLEALLGEAPVAAADLHARCATWRERLRPFATDTGAVLRAALAAGKRVLLEGAQGVMLDVDHGTYPFVTSSNATAGGACTGSGIPPGRIDRVVAVVKAYTTRVGEGPFPTELLGAEGDRLREAGGEFGTTTGRPRRCGWYDVPVARFAARVNGVTDFVLTKLDVLTGLDSVPVCVAYDVDGTRLEELPVNQSDVHHARPVYEQLPGWTEDLSGARDLDDLPPNARAYVRFLEDLSGAPFSVVGVGPGRAECVVVRSLV